MKGGRKGRRQVTGNEIKYTEKEGNIKRWRKASKKVQVSRQEGTKGPSKRGKGKERCR